MVYVIISQCIALYYAVVREQQAGACFDYATNHSPAPSSSFHLHPDHDHDLDDHDDDDDDDVDDDDEHGA